MEFDDRIRIKRSLDEKDYYKWIIYRDDSFSFRPQSVLTAMKKSEKQKELLCQYYNVDIFNRYQDALNMSKQSLHRSLYQFEEKYYYDCMELSSPKIEDYFIIAQKHNDYRYLESIIRTLDSVLKKRNYLEFVYLAADPCHEIIKELVLSEEYADKYLDKIYSNSNRKPSKLEKIIYGISDATSRINELCTASNERNQREKNRVELNVKQIENNAKSISSDKDLIRRFVNSTGVEKEGYGRELTRRGYFQINSDGKYIKTNKVPKN
ncbi:hypothetical protein GMB50_10500 [Turicibacter sanguinis]|nr:hypothetical protein [Turicibacter sanguinis]MTP47949.1 hypothetical protein [Turicibacter sanguinis]MTP50697.1 hypothetical protein [Turicibacter sanguinis]MTQ07933.1 hypothetical protein [Turicibacter sanguinis]